MTGPLAATTVTRTLWITDGDPSQMAEGVGSGGSEPSAVLETTTTAKIICGDGAEPARQIVRGWMNTYVLWASGRHGAIEASAQMINHQLRYIEGRTLQGPKWQKR